MLHTDFISGYGMLPVLTSEDMRKWDAHTIENEPISSIDLMERASEAFVKAFLQDFPNERDIVILCGPGNNGGDGLAIARLLKEKGLEVSTFMLNEGRDLSPDAQVNLDRLEDVSFDVEQAFGQAAGAGTLVIDALLGSGLSKPLKGLYAELATALNFKRKKIVSVDMPTGMFSEDLLPDVGHPLEENSPAFKAAMVYTFQAPKLSLLLPEHAEYVQDFRVLDIGLDQEFMSGVDSPHAKFHLVKSRPKFLYEPQRNKFGHKGTFGRVAVLAGSKGMAGSAALCAEAALRSGCGLCTLFVPESVLPIVQGLVPEATAVAGMHPDHHVDHWDLDEFDAIALGPGLGMHTETAMMVKHILKNSSTPLVLDADALNIIAEHSWQDLVPRFSVLTPHPKEFERLFGATKNSLEAMELQEKLSMENEWTIVRKGAHTFITDWRHGRFFNGTGNHGMAKGGSGDVLTGVIASLRAQSYYGNFAAVLGVNEHGRAGDKAAARKGVRNMLARDIINELFADRMY